jgi:dTDP-glucose 4,6-dehydratase
MTLLVTGGAGFIGSHFIDVYLGGVYSAQKTKIINLDNLSYAGNLDNTVSFQEHPAYHFVQGDITDATLLKYLFETHDIKGVIHFAAESHVDNSITRPISFVETNVVGTAQLLEAARKHWMSAPFKTKAGYEQARFCHISTDEVYGSTLTGVFTEQSAYQPNSPYSASKAGADMMARAYYHTYGLNVITTNCSNNFGPRQHSEKLIPTVIRKVLAGEPIPIYGDGLYTRDWLYVVDHCQAILRCFEQGKAGEVYVIGTRNEQMNITLVELIGEILNKKCLIQHVPDRPGHDRRYAIDPTKIEQELGWCAKTDFITALRDTVEWYSSINELA